MVTRGEVWLATLDPTVGGEIKKTRPCLIISPSEIHGHLRTVIVAPMTSGSRQAGFRVPVKFRGVTGLILLEQSRALDKQRLLKKLGAVPDAVLRRVLKTLRELYEE
ncbi:MAG: type II toxin-antitoxin system PemK/MazF family toxin [Hyphomicrobiales bacterium]|nr:type II toxin-antitoxin system PemK/MazF family toxin [Hyphomicrobiales bacterium]MBV9517530.1 type II toxin-antitoxin system PemK/MazF family toxin [Hyphomicrobiales bacterium]